MGGEISTPEPPLDNAKEAQIPDLSRLGPKPAQTAGKAVPDLPDDVVHMIYTFAKERQGHEDRAAAIVDSAEDLFGCTKRTYSLGEFCALLGDPTFQAWLVEKHLQGDRAKTALVIQALHNVYVSYMRAPMEMNKHNQLVDMFNRTSATRRLARCSSCALI